MSFRFGRVAVVVGIVAVAGVGFWRKPVDMEAARAANAALRLSGKQAVVVGGTSGIGASIALRLAQANASVTIVGRSKERAEKVVESMRAVSEDGTFSFVQCDCFSLRDVDRCSKEILAALPSSSSEPPVLDYLVLSQGMATIQGFTPTEDGLDQKLTLHVWSRAAFARHLLPALAHSSVRFGSFVMFVQKPTFCS